MLHCLGIGPPFNVETKTKGKLTVSAFHWIGHRLATYLSKPSRYAVENLPTPVEALSKTLQPCDVLLVEGNSRFSTAIKYLTQSTWSHAALYVGDALPEVMSGEPRNVLIEADVVEGVRAVALERYCNFNIRIARPLGLSQEDRHRIVAFAIDRLGNQYDLRNVIDLARYILPTPPVPQLFRRRLLSLGSGDPTRAICSTLIAQAFQSIRYPILPLVTRMKLTDPMRRNHYNDTLHVRHHSLFAPRDFDISPYFEIVKPTIAHGFDFHTLKWAHSSKPSDNSQPTRIE